jgi:hypothetical protein
LTKEPFRRGTRTFSGRWCGRLCKRSRGPRSGDGSGAGEKDEPTSEIQNIRLIRKWLRVGILEDGAVTISDKGTAQGAVISPLLANTYLHYVLGLWAERWRRRDAAVALPADPVFDETDQPILAQRV